jgi:hypothetical protein
MTQTTGKQMIVCPECKGKKVKEWSDPYAREGKLTISAPESSSKGRYCVRIQVSTQDEIINIEIPHKEFSMCVTGLARIDCNVETSIKNPGP